MPTDLQENLAEAIVKNKKLPPYKRKNKQTLVASSGYSEISADRHAKTIIEAKGVQDALRKYGLTEGLITRALVNDIKKKPRKRLGELSLGAEILGMTDNKEKNQNASSSTLIQININPPNGQSIEHQPDSEAISRVASITEPRNS